jgi:hypothetical protein
MATQQGQHRDGGTGAKQGGEQLVDLGVGGLAVIAGHLDADGCGDQGVFQNLGLRHMDVPDGMAHHPALGVAALDLNIRQLGHGSVSQR